MNRDTYDSQSDISLSYSYWTCRGHGEGVNKRTSESSRKKYKRKSRGRKPVLTVRPLSPSEIVSLP